ncbi:MAG: FHA domain-containing protein [Chloroflexota bacterium]
MADNNDNRQPNHDESLPLLDESDEDPTAPDLRAIAEEAMRLLQQNAESSAQETEAVTTFSDNTEKPSTIAMNKKSDETTQASVIQEENGETTNDLLQEAIKARALEAQRKREATQKARYAVQERSRFTQDMRLKLESGESSDSIIKAVTSELVVGRADNVTDYIPEIDLTPHGAYRLGLSRRHAVILWENERVMVRDLNSRNGTFVNGAIVPGGGTMVLRDGDEVRFGNLAMKVSFISADS